MIARYSSLCPLCGLYIAKSRSEIARLPAAISVQPELWPLRLRSGWHTASGHYSPEADVKPRVWVHARCYDAGMSLLGASSDRPPPPVGLMEHNCDYCGAPFLRLRDGGNAHCARHTWMAR